MSSDSRPSVLHLLDSLDGGGTQRALVSLLHRFDRSRFRHAVLTLRAAGRWAKHLPDDVSCQPLGTTGRDRLTGWKVASVARRLRPAILHARNAGTWFDALVATMFLPRARLVLGFHGLDHAGPMDSKTRYLARWALRTNASFATVAQSGKSRLVHELSIPSNRISVLPNGVDLERFQPVPRVEQNAGKTELGLSSETFVVGWVGSLTAVKRSDLLIDALRFTGSCKRRLHAVIVGDGPLRGSLERQIIGAGLTDRVTLAGAHEDIRPLLAACDVLVSSSDSEEMSNSVLEAMACGIPVVGTDVGDTRAMVQDGVGGLIVEPGKPYAMAEALVRLADNDHGRSELAKGARRRAEAFNLGSSVDGYEQFYASCLQGRPADQPSQTPSMVMSSLCGAAPTNAVTCLRT